MIKTLKVAATSYTVSEVEKPGADFGTCDHILRRIKLRKSLRPRDKYMTLLHEAIHAVCQEYGLAQYFHGEGEELMVRAMEVGISNLFIENRKFAKELIETLSASK